MGFADGPFSIHLAQGTFAPGEPVAVEAVAPAGTPVTFEVLSPGSPGAPARALLIMTAQANVTGVARITFSLAGQPEGVYEVLASAGPQMFSRASFSLASAKAPPAPQTFTLTPLGTGGVVFVLLIGAAFAGTSRGQLWWSVSLAVPLFTRLNRDAVKNQYQRGRLIQLIEDSPGLSYSQIRRKLGLSNGACAYHLRVLEKSGEIRRVVNGAFVCFYGADFKPDADALPPLALVQRKVLGVLSAGHEGTAGEIAERLRAQGLEVTEANASYHLRVLVREKELVLARRERGRTVYFLEAGQREYLAARLRVEDSADALLAEEEQAGSAEEVIPGGAAEHGAADLAKDAVYSGPLQGPLAAHVFLLEAVYVFDALGNLLHLQGNPERSAPAPPSTPMLRHVQPLVAEAIRAGVLRRDADIGDHQVLVVRGQHLCLAVTAYGEPGPGLSAALQRLLERLERLYGALLEGPVVPQRSLPEVASQVRPLFALSRGVSRQAVRAQIAAEPLSVRLEGYAAAGYQCLRIRLKNNTGANFAELRLEVEFDAEAMVLDRMEPEFPWVRGRYKIGDLPARGRAELRLFFDPQRCGSFPLEGDIKFKGPSGTTEVARLAPFVVLVEAPPMDRGSKPTLETLRAVLLDKQSHVAEREFRLRAEYEPGGVSQLLRDAIGSIGLAPGDAPPELSGMRKEAWFCAEMEARPLAVRTILRPAEQLLQLTVATPDAAWTAGILAAIQEQCPWMSRVPSAADAQAAGAQAEEGPEQRTNIPARR